MPSLASLAFNDFIATRDQAAPCPRRTSGSKTRTPRTHARNPVYMLYYSRSGVIYGRSTRDVNSQRRPVKKIKVTSRETERERKPTPRSKGVSSSLHCTTAVQHLELIYSVLAKLSPPLGKKLLAHSQPPTIRDQLLQHPLGSTASIPRGKGLEIHQQRIENLRRKGASYTQSP